MSRTANKEERKWMAKIKELGCIVCINENHIRPFTVPENYTAVHHIGGQTKPGAHLNTIPLCPHHHQHDHHARHVNKTQFENLHGKEAELLAKTKEYLLTIN